MNAFGEGPHANVRGYAMRRAMAVLAEIGDDPSSNVTVEARSESLRLGLSQPSASFTATLLLTTVVTGTLPPMVTRWSDFVAASPEAISFKLRPDRRTLVVQPEGADAVAIPAHRAVVGPDLLQSRLSRFRATAMLAPEHADLLARTIEGGRGHPVDGVAVSPRGWAGASDGERFVVVPLAQCHHHRHVVVPGPLFRAASIFGPDDVTIEVNRRDEHPAVRMMAFAGRDILVLEGDGLPSSFPDLSDMTTERHRPVVEIDDAGEFRRATTTTGHGGAVVLREINGHAEVRAVTNVDVPGMRFGGRVGEELHLPAAGLLDLLDGREGPLVLSCGDQERQRICLSSNDGVLRGLMTLPKVRKAANRGRRSARRGSSRG